MDSLFDPATLARVTDPQTSHQAARQLHAVTITRTRSEILRLLRAAPDGLTDPQIEERFTIAHSLSGVRTRRKELQAAGQVRDSGRRVRGATGRKMIVWTVTR